MEAEVLTSVVQITNIAPQATRDQMLTLFSYVGKIEDLRLYPHLRDVSMNVNARCCFVKFSDSSCVPVAQHLTNTVFIDRAIIVTPVKGEIPNEQDGLVMASQFQQGSSVGNGIGRMGGSGVNGSAVSSAPVTTPYPKLDELGLPPYPVLPVGTPLSKVDEMRRTITVVGIDSTVSAQACMEMFSEAGEVKYFRYCMRMGDPIKYALIEFTEQDSVPRALQFNDRTLGMSKIKVTHSIQAINKPQAKTSEAVQREIEEAMSKVKETQSLVSAAVDPLMGILGSSRSSRTRSRSRSRSRRSRSRDRSLHSSRRSHSRDRRRRSRSRSRDRRRSRSRERRRRSRSRSRDRKRVKRSKSRSREKRKRSRSRSRDRKKDKDKENKSGNKEKVKEKEKAADVAVDEEKVEKSSTPEVVVKEASVENGSANEESKAVVEVEEPKRKSRSRSKSKKRSRSRSRSKKRSRSREKKRKSRSRSRERRRSRSRDKDRKSRRSSSKERRRKRSRDRKRKSRSRSKERSSKSSKSTRSKDKSDVPKVTEATKGEESKHSVDCDDMEISNSP